MKIAVLLAEGFEIAEAMCPADVFRRAGLDTVLISVSDSKEVRSSCGIIVTADKTINEAEDEDFNAVFCPGGMPGSVNLSQSWEAGRMIVKTAQSGIVAAICAAPAAVLYPLGILDGRNATCYPLIGRGHKGWEYHNGKERRLGIRSRSGGHRSPCWQGEERGGKGRDLL